MSKIKFNINELNLDLKDYQDLFNFVDDLFIKKRYDEAMKAKENNQLIDLEGLDDYIANNH